MIDAVGSGLFLLFGTLISGLFVLVGWSSVFLYDTFLPAHCTYRIGKFQGVFPESVARRWEKEAGSMRVAGCLASALGLFFLWIALRTLLSWILHPRAIEVSPEALSKGAAYGCIVMGLGIFTCSIWMFASVRRRIEQGFEMWPRVVLITPRVLRFWMFYHRYCAVVFFTGGIWFLVEGLRNLL